jgi:flagellar basal body-associated protein FliL
MAITLEQKETENKERKFAFPLWLIVIIIFVLVFGTISYFLFFQKLPKAEQVELKEKKEGLSKEEIAKVGTLLKEIDSPAFKSLTTIIPKSIISEPEVNPGKLGRSNPFSP